MATIARGDPAVDFPRPRTTEQTQIALVRLDAENIVELDPERKGAMASNLLVVLCSDHATVPVINTGSLYY